MPNSDEDSAVFEKLREAAELYNVYATLAAAADRATLTRIAAEAASDEDDGAEEEFRPLPLTIAFRRNV